MAPRYTRSKTSTVAVAEAPTTRLVRIEGERHALLVLPNDASADARIISLHNQAFSSTVRYFFCPRLGLYEFTKIGHPKQSLQSCLITPEESTVADSSTGSGTLAQKSTTISHDEATVPELDQGYVLEDGHVFVATPYDPVFLLTSLFSESEGYYRPADDHLDQLTETTPGLASLLRSGTFRKTLLDRLAHISATQDIGGGELVYKPQLRLLVDVLIGKATRSAETSWPASMEESHVQKILELPMLPSQVSTGPDSGVLDSKQTEAEGTEPEQSTSEAGGGHTSSIPAEVTNLMRRRVAFDFMLSSYIPPKLRSSLQSLFQAEMQVGFAPLEDHLAKVKSAKAEVQALRALSDNISRKRSALDDDEAAEARAEKKQKKEEEEKRKKAETRASKVLKKVDTTGMKKLSSFFSKTAAPAMTQKTSS